MDKIHKKRFTIREAARVLRKTELEVTRMIYRNKIGHFMGDTKTPISGDGLLLAVLRQVIAQRTDIRRRFIVATREKPKLRKWIIPPRGA